MNKLENDEIRKPMKKFRPRKTPRYLAGSVETVTLKRDLKEYNKHLYKVFTAESKLDTKPPAFHPTNYLKMQQVYAGICGLRQIDRDNKELLYKINCINRNKGYIDSFNPIANTRLSRWPLKKTQLAQQKKENRKFYKKLMSVKSQYSREEHEKQWKHTMRLFEYYSKYPLVIFNKKSKDDELKELPSMSSGLDNVAVEDAANRPKCFIEFSVKGGLKLGTIIVELYYDHAPVTVQNFISLCTGENKLTFKNCPVHKIYKDKYCVLGDITKGDGKGGTSIYGDSFEQEENGLKHTKAGVLSMITFNKNLNNSQFCITFTKMAEFDGKQVAFGKVIKGAQHLFKVNDMGRKFGKPIVEIFVSRCGQCAEKKTSQ